jgi:TrmH family RNA methyltransferase
MPELISSHANPIVKLIRSLHQKKGRTESGLFLIEGIFPVGEAIEAGWQLDSLVYAPDLLTSGFALHIVEDQIQRGSRCIALSSDLFTDIAAKENPQGILAIARQRHLNLDGVASKHFHWGAALISPQDPGNVGTILRTLDAVGADGLFLLDGGVELYHPSVVRASMGTLFWKIVVEASFDEFAIWRKKNNYRLVGSSSHAGTDYHKLQREAKPIILILGNEQKGLSPEQISNCDEIVTMPMVGRVSSLNLAVAAGILLYQMAENK